MPRLATMVFAAVAVASLIGVLAGGFLLSRYGSEPISGGPEAATHGSGAAGSFAPDAFAFAFRERPRPLPAVRFVDGAGHSLSLGDFRGRPLVLNLWATWCVPCRKEMPALDRLQAQFGKSRLLVVPLSIDRRGAPAVRQFYRDLGLDALGIYVDRSGEAPAELDAAGVPTTLLVDRGGREIGRKIGAAEWDGPHIVNLIVHHLEVQADRRQAGP